MESSSSSLPAVGPARPMSTPEIVHTLLSMAKTAQTGLTTAEEKTAVTALQMLGIKDPSEYQHDAPAIIASCTELGRRSLEFRTVMQQIGSLHPTLRPIVQDGNLELFYDGLKKALPPYCDKYWQSVFCTMRSISPIISLYHKKVKAGEIAGLSISDNHLHFAQGLADLSTISLKNEVGPGWGMRTQLVAGKACSLIAPSSPFKERIGTAIGYLNVMYNDSTNKTSEVAQNILRLSILLNELTSCEEFLTLGNTAVYIRPSVGLEHKVLGEQYWGDELVGPDLLTDQFLTRQ